MPIKRCSSQSSQGRVSLTDSYVEFIRPPEEPGGKDDHMSTVGKSMIQLIEMINDTFEETQLWGLTSHARLIIQKEDDYQSERYVIIEPGGGDGHYRINYLLPKNQWPWKNARVIGFAKSLEEVKRFFVIAMNECEGWKGNQELIELVNKLEE